MLTLKNLLEQKKCFKLVCGAGNKNLDEVEKLVAIYAKAGCRFFDISADKEVLNSAKKGLKVISEKERRNCHFCISIGTKNDFHIQKATIDKNTCVKCGKCYEICPQNAITKDFTIISTNCIGCQRCKKTCSTNSITFNSDKKNNWKEILTSVKDEISCVELHSSGVDEKEAKEIWEYLCKDFGEKILSLCISRENLSNKEFLKLVKDLTSKRKSFTTIIQADGAPMSGGCDDYKTTLQAVSSAELIQDQNLPAYLMLSGGTNSKSAELATLCGIDFTGVAVGSFARKIVKNFTQKKDLLKTEAIFEEASKIASILIKKN